MSKLRIEHGASKSRWIVLKTTVEESTAADIELLCQWSENDRRYVINELLRFALTQDEDFLKYTAGLAANPSKPANSTKPAPAPGKVIPDAPTKSDSTSTNHA